MKIKIKTDSVEMKSTKLHRKRRKLQDVEMPRKKLKGDNLNENAEGIGGISFADELAQLARDDPALYEFLKHEEQDLFEEASDGLDRVGDQGSAMDEEKDHEEDGVEKTKKDQKIFALAGIKSHKIELQKDSTTGRLLISKELISLLDIVLSNPDEYKKALPRATETAIKAFIACVAYIGGSGLKLAKNSQLEYLVLNEIVFDKIIQLSFQALGKCLYHLLEPVEKNKKCKKLKNGALKKQREHFKYWHRYSGLAKKYMEALNILLFELRSNDVVVCAIRAVTDLVGLYLHSTKLGKNLIKSLVRIWSQQPVEEVRCIAFVALSKMARMDSDFFPIIYKSCYVAYISNCKLVDEETLPSINFMKRAFIELTFMRPSIAYEYAFVYIRQFAIHLRNAMIAKRKELVQTIYNWQFIKGLQVWTELVAEGARRFPYVSSESGTTQNVENNNWFRELVHPLVEIISITQRISLSSKYLPLSIHCIRMLLTIQRECNIFIPTLSSAVELLDELAQMDSKKPQSGKGVVKGILLDRMLRLSREQHDNWGVRLYLAQQLAELITNALNTLKTHEYDYRSLLTPIGIKIRRFIKASRNREFVQLFTPIKKQISGED